MHQNSTFLQQQAHQLLSKLKFLHISFIRWSFYTKTSHPFCYLPTASQHCWRYNYSIFNGATQPFLRHFRFWNLCAKHCTEILKATHYLPSSGVTNFVFSFICWFTTNFLICTSHFFNPHVQNQIFPKGLEINKQS